MWGEKQTNFFYYLKIDVVFKGHFFTLSVLSYLILYLFKFIKVTKTWFCSIYLIEIIILPFFGYRIFKIVITI